MLPFDLEFLHCFRNASPNLLFIFVERRTVEVTVPSVDGSLNDISHGCVVAENIVRSKTDGRDLVHWIQFFDSERCGAGGAKGGGRCLWRCKGVEVRV